MQHIRPMSNKSNKSQQYLLQQILNGMFIQIFLQKPRPSNSQHKWMRTSGKKLSPCKLVRSEQLFAFSVDKHHYKKCSYVYKVLIQFPNSGRARWSTVIEPLKCPVDVQGPTESWNRVYVYLVAFHGGLSLIALLKPDRHASRNRVIWRSHSRSCAFRAVTDLIQSQTIPLFHFAKQIQKIISRKASTGLTQPTSNSGQTTSPQQWISLTL